nr:unnamed protein product [Spirometra erinaceieuropaei]
MREDGRILGVRDVCRQQGLPSHPQMLPFVMVHISITTTGIRYGPRVGQAHLPRGSFGGFEGAGDRGGGGGGGGGDGGGGGGGGGDDDDDDGDGDGDGDGGVGGDGGGGDGGGGGGGSGRWLWDVGRRPIGRESA